VVKPVSGIGLDIFRAMETMGHQKLTAGSAWFSRN